MVYHTHAANPNFYFSKSQVSDIAHGLLIIWPLGLKILLSLQWKDQGGWFEVGASQDVTEEGF